jgi:ABC-2 type transport system permease protein
MSPIRTGDAVNWTGLRTLARREIRRFLKVHTQTVWAPVAMTLLFYTVFSLALGSRGNRSGDIPYLVFLAPGLIMMAMVQNAFANTASSIMISKSQGNIVDVLMAPLTPAEMLCGYIAGGIARGMVVGLVAWLAIRILVPVDPVAPALVLFHGLAASMLLALLGFAGGVWAQKFDHIGAVTNFVVTPLSFLSGTFYTVDRLPEGWAFVAHLNPFFYMIDGFRAGFTGIASASVPVGIVVMIAANLALLGLAHRMIVTGYHLKP